MRLTQAAVNLLIACSTILLASQNATAAAAPTYWDPAVGGNGHYYALIEESLPWAAARERAPLLDVPAGYNLGHIATISNAAENEFISSSFFHPANAFIGFTDEVVEGEWRWIDDTPGIWQDPNYFAEPIQTAFTFWGPDEPNNYLGNQDYGHIVWADDPRGVWDDATEFVNNFIVEWDALPVPEPNALSLSACAIGVLVCFASWRRLVLSLRRPARSLWVKQRALIASWLLCHLPLLAGPSDVQAAPSTYKVIDIGDLPGGRNYSDARGLNNLGQVAGVSLGYIGNGEIDDYRGYIWDRAQGIRDIGALSTPDHGVGYTEAKGINDSGQVVGISRGPAGYHAFVWDALNGMHDLGDLGHGSSDANGVNDLGHVVGDLSGDGGPHPFLWTASGGMLDLGFRGVAFGINNNDWVIGQLHIGTEPTVYRGFVWDEVNGMRDIGPSPGGGPGLTEVFGVNDLGEVVGTSNGGRASIWDETRGARALVGMENVAASAVDVNNVGQVVGDVRNAGGRPYIWDAANGFRDLNALVVPSSAGWDLRNVTAINDLGWIAGNGISPTGRTHAFLLIPVPEPSALSLASCFVGALGFVAWFRRGDFSMRISRFKEPVQP